MIDKRRRTFDTSVFADIKTVLLRIALRTVIALEILTVVIMLLFLINQVYNGTSYNNILGTAPLIKLAVSGALLLEYSKLHYAALVTTDRANREKYCSKALAVYLLVCSLLIASIQQWCALIFNIIEPSIFTGSFVAISIPLLILMGDFALTRYAAILEVALAFLDFTLYIMLQTKENMTVTLITWISQTFLWCVVLYATIIVRFAFKKIIKCYEVKLNSTESYRNVAETDTLTGLSNRRALDIDISIISSIGRKKVSVVMLDIDKFKQFNDAYGHQVGDYVLNSVGNLAKSIGEEDMCEAYRYGGEEILMIFVDKPVEAVKQRVELFRTAVANIKIPGVPNSHITISAGLVSSEIPDLRKAGLADEKLLEAGSAIMQNLINKADNNLYIAKDTGRNKLITGCISISASQKRGERKNATT